MATIEIRFDKGTLVLAHLERDYATRLPQVKWDGRTRNFRAPAYRYREIILQLRRDSKPYLDKARTWAPCKFPLQEEIAARDYQQAALKAWRDAGSRGVVVLPTGSGKTILAVMMIRQTGRPTLIHVPTIDLMQQWRQVLQRYFTGPIGLLGGGYQEIEDITVATYDSAILHVSGKGNRFGFVVFDECHHLPGEQYQFAALASMAPFRLGLTATPERNDGKEARLYELVGPICYQAHIDQMEGGALAPYRLVTVPVDLNPEERREYQLARETYLNFLRSQQIDMGQPRGWQLFIWKSSRTPEGREAFKAYLRQKQLSLAARSKMEKIWELFCRRRGDRILIFTQDNEMAYRIGRQFLLPVLTHHTRLKEREAFLEAFREGRYPVLVTSKVLNEGVDVPEANVAIIVSGSGSVREHVQRLGRILRPRPGKEAVLYELVSKDTAEQFIHQRRRKHRAYQKPDSL